MRGGVSHQGAAGSIDAQFMERARQNKRKAAARASASFASMKLNAALDEGDRLMEKHMAVCPYAAPAAR